MRQKKVLVIAGGTGGHIFPALAVAEELSRRGIEICWLGSLSGLEKTLVPPQYSSIYIDAKRVRGKGWRAYLLAPWRLMSSTWQAWKEIRLLKPDVVLAMGGFVSGPGGIAAKLLGIPLVIHEQNAISGYSNRLLALFANRILAAYPGAFSSRKNLKVIGNPVRAKFSTIQSPEERFRDRQGPLRLLILGGSQGAHALNEIMVRFASEFNEPHQLAIWHQTGKKDLAPIQEKYLGLPVQAKVEAFIDDMAGAYQWADCLICRAGALTVAEIAAVGVAGILVPFPAAVDDHQWYNARFLEEAGAGIIIRESDLSSERLAGLVNQFLANRKLLTDMAVKARQLAKMDAAEQAAQVVLQELQN